MQVIHVDLASGGTELMINECGTLSTLLHPGPCQVILPANYLVQMVFPWSGESMGCKIRHPKRGRLEVYSCERLPIDS